jgi:hypothetical protein
MVAAFAETRLLAATALPDLAAEERLQPMFALYLSRT